MRRRASARHGLRVLQGFAVVNVIDGTARCEGARLEPVSVSREDSGSVGNFLCGEGFEAGPRESSRERERSADDPFGLQEGRFDRFPYRR